jgi:hypothetical protein
VRAGPLSDARVIDLLNHYCVPIYISTDDFEEKSGQAPAPEKKEFVRLFGDINEAKKGMGYVLTPEEKMIETFVSSPAVTSEQVFAFLDNAIKKLGAKRGEILGKVTPQASAPQADPDQLVLHLTARFLPSGAGWARMPAEDYLVLGPADWKSLLVPAGAKVGDSRDIDPALVKTLLIHFYPPSLNFYCTKNVIDRPAMRATVVAVKDGVARIRLDSDLKMKHTFVPDKDDNLHVEAAVVGLVDCNLVRQTIRSVQMVTDKATYAGGYFGVAVRSLNVPRP